jgi:hypothetical protein
MKNIDNLLNIKRQMMQEFEVSNKEYICLQFEYGCRFIESLPNMNKEVVDKLKYDPNYGFWEWWIKQWTNDDESILIEKPSHPSYKELKSAMIDCGVLYQRLKYFIRTKQKKYK